MKFYLGTDNPSWLKTSTVPLFISHRRLSGRKNLSIYKTNIRWCVDSGGFTELNLHGRWTTTPKEYVNSVERYMEHIGNIDWVAPQDAMCEPWILEKSRDWLGGTVQAHQVYTVENYLELAGLAPHVPFIPTLQGWEMDDYLCHIEMYNSYGVDLRQFQTVGLGSVCRRESTKQIGEIVKNLHQKGLNLHGFGMKTGGVAKFGKFLTSSDSMAWSFAARMRGPSPCPHKGTKSCNHCYPFAMEWRQNLFSKAASNGVVLEDF